MPFVRLWDHGFQGSTGKWYIENSLTTLGKEDPVGVVNKQLWNTGNPEDKKTAQKQKRRLHYISNIYVVKDSANPFFKSKSADLASVREACNGPLTKHGIAVVQAPSVNGAMLHESGGGCSPTSQFHSAASSPSSWPLSQ